MRVLEVIDPGPLTTVQDLGRPGWAHLGVPRSGALDAPAAALAQRLVGNPEHFALLETTLGGVTVRAGAALTLAVTGAPAEVSVEGRVVAFGEPVHARAGSVVRVGPAVAGVRSYLAVGGGVDVPAVLGSRSTDTLAGTGPGILRTGTVLSVGAAVDRPGALDVAEVRRPAEHVLLRLRPGPRADWFAPDVLDTLAAAPYSVGVASNRVGLRLVGALLARRRDDELPSEGLVLGAVQVPSSGQPLLFLHDHPTTGGYPVLGVVDPADLPACAQLRPGGRVSFRVV